MRIKHNKGNTKEIEIPKQDEKLAEFIGIVLGDGHLHKEYNRVTIAGSLEDIYYYKYNVIPLMKSLFNVEPKLKKYPTKNSFYLYFESKEVMDFLVNKGMRRGNKINALIPPFLKTNKKLISSFLRGLFDTDGCLKFSKQTKSINYYPRIRFFCRKSPLAEGISFLLNKLNFNFSEWKDLRRERPVSYYEISGEKNLIKWMKLIKSSNPVHWTKFLLWKKCGYGIPRSSLKERLKILKFGIKNLDRNLFKHFTN